MVRRLIKPLKSNSFFLFGARGTGKSTFVRGYLPKDSLYLDLLDESLYDELLREPKRLERMSQEHKHNWIIIDEVQRLPRLLNIVHRLIEANGQKFALTGSSGRKLKRGAGNLLAGRAFMNTLFPFTTLELQDHFDLNQALSWGTLPKILNLSSADEKKAYLRSYALAYVREEIQIEQVVRKLEPFREFLAVAAQSSGQIVNFSAVSRDVGVEVPTVQNYFQILEDTYLGFLLPHFHRSIRKSQIHSPKFYFFDNGLKRSLEGSLDSLPIEGTFQFGSLFEAYIIQEIYRLNDYFHKDFRLSFFRTKNDAEIDLILSKGQRTILIEIKSSTRVDEIEVRKLARLKTEFGKQVTAYYLSRDPLESEIDGVKCRFWRQFLDSEFQSSKT
jgi:predicted AAA+ superfamily ATPase